jgi:type II secretory pathway pseudopilin PulG
MKTRQRGATLVEILISLAIVLVGLAGMFRILASSVQGSSSASKISQAQYRAETILESIRSSPANGLICLAGTAPGDWGVCEGFCRAALGGTASLTSCLFTTAAMTKLAAPDVTSLTPASSTIGQKTDRSNQVYFLAASGAGDGARNDSFVKLAGPNSRVYDVQVAVAWNDDNTETLKSSTHTVVLRSGMFR